MSRASIVHLKAVAHAADGAVIPASQTSALGEVDELLATANSVLADAQSDAAALRDAAHAQGYEQGQTQAREEMTKALAAQHRRGHALFEAQTAQVQEMALTIVERLAPELDAGHLVQPMVTRAILAAQADQYLQVRVHPSQLEVARSAIDELGHVHPAVSAYQVIADDTVDVLACVVQTEVGAVRSSVEQQIEAIRAALSAPMTSDDEHVPER